MIIDKLAWVYIKNQQLLVVRSKGKDLFYIPGGKREQGETDEDALIRETQEELSVTLRGQTIRYMNSFQAQAHGRPLGDLVKVTCYIADFDGRLEVNSEIEELAWVGYTDKNKCSQVTQLILDWLKTNNLITLKVSTEEEEVEKSSRFFRT